MRNISYIAVAAIAALTLPLAAQNACNGPGSAFGIVSYQCGDCTIDQKPGTLTTWRFGVEPLVLKTADGSVLQSGDIVEAVNGTPITTDAGAALFTYPAGGESEVIVRRGGQRTTLHVHTVGDCAKVAAALAQLQRSNQLQGSVERARNFDSLIKVQQLIYDSLITRNRLKNDSLITAYQFGFGRATRSATTPTPGVVVDIADEGPFAWQAVEKRHDRFGFAIECAPCTRQLRPDGSTYWTFKSNPRIGMVDSTGPAARAGLRAGDVILTVNGKPVLEEAASNALAQSSEATTLSLTVQHKDGSRLTVQLKSR